MFSNKYIFIYSTIMVVIAATGLTLAALVLKPAQDFNIRVEKMQNILQAVNISSEKKTIESTYKKYIFDSFLVNTKGEKVEGDAFKTELVYELKKPVDQRVLPVYVCRQDNGDTNYIVQLRGKGLWGPIWGYISFKTDFNTIVGAMYDHKGETPGLGAEINTAAFQNEFIGKTIFDESGKFVSIAVTKPSLGIKTNHNVDGISGGTITSVGLQYMVNDCLTDYLAFFEKNKK